MSIVNLSLDPIGRGVLVVDGVNLSGITSAVSIVSSVGEANKVTVDLGACTLQDIQIQGADLIIKGERIPESVQAALYEFLRNKFDQIDVTVLSDDSRKYAIKRA
ncbi:hypothetical protein [Pseudomonas abietaniphila]